MRTIVASDLHLGAGTGADLLRRPRFRDALVEAVDGADRLVLLGDVIELRDRPVDEAIALARPVLGELAAALGDGELVIVPGNHDHRLVSSWLERRRADGVPISLGEAAPVDAWPFAELVDALGGVTPTLRYPGMWLRDGVYATHGHYLDRHLTIPTFERLGVALVERMLGLEPGGADPLDPPDLPVAPRSVEEYERVQAPIYAFLFSLAQGGTRGRPGGTPSKRIWDALSGGNTASAKLRGWLLGAVALPGAVGAANRLGLGPVRSDLSPGTITRAGVEAMLEVTESLPLDPQHVIFGHTHRRGPMAGEDAEAWQRDGVALHNTGSWVFSPSLVRQSAEGSAYWPGTVAVVLDEGPPRLEHLLDEVTRDELAGG